VLSTHCRAVTLADERFAEDLAELEAEDEEKQTSDE
jgi:hypothetical protein